MLEQFSSVEQIFIVVAILYLIEMLVWARGESCVVSSFFGKFRLRTGKSFLANDFGRLYFSGLTPWDATFVLQSLPVSIDVARLTNLVEAAPGSNRRADLSPMLLSHDDISQLTRDNQKILYKGQLFCSLPTASSASSFLHRVNEIAKSADDAERLRQLQKLQLDQLNVAAVESRIATWKQSTNALSWCGTLLLFWIFVVGPVLYYLPLIPEERVLVLVAYLCVLFFTWWTCVVQVYFAHKRLFANKTLDRLLQTFICFASPAAAIRGRDHLSRHLFAWVHPFAVLQALRIREAEFFAEVSARDAEFPMPFDLDSAVDDALLATVHSHHHRYKAALIASFTENGYDYQELVAAPELEDAETRAYCERCLHEYSEPGVHCESCNGRFTSTLVRDLLP